MDSVSPAAFFTNVKLKKRGLDHRGKLDGNDDLRRFAQTVERVNDLQLFLDFNLLIPRPALTRSNPAS